MEIQTGFLLCFFRVSLNEYMLLIIIFCEKIKKKNIFCMILSWKTLTIYNRI